VRPVAWGRVESPLGPLHVGVSELGLARIAVTSEPPEQDRLSNGEERVVDVRRQLDEYFAGERREFTMPLDWSGVTGFRLRALEAMGRVPYGETVTYAELAGRAGNLRAARAAGHACATNPIPIVLPCHRIVGSDGTLRGYMGGIHLKELLLRLEGALSTVDRASDQPSFIV
jgi:methylated-DNA-[protein]-cysteine S-methyltransferase